MNHVAANPPQPQPITCLLGHAENRYVFLIGGGGKTTLMFALAKWLSDDGRTVITTTSTKILHPPSEASRAVVIEADVPRLIPCAREALRDTAHVTIGRARLAGNGNKLCGFSEHDLDRLHEANIADYILVEADGAAGRSIKAHGDHEPVVSPRADLVIAVIGIDCIGKPLSDKHVHRPWRYADILGCAQGAPITAKDISTLFFHPQGYLKAVGPQTEVAVFLSKVKSPTDSENADLLANALQVGDRTKRVARIAVGDLAGPAQLVRSFSSLPEADPPAHDPFPAKRK